MASQTTCMQSKLFTAQMMGCGPRFARQQKPASPVSRQMDQPHALACFTEPSDWRLEQEIPAPLPIQRACNGSWSRWPLTHADMKTCLRSWYSLSGERGRQGYIAAGGGHETLSQARCHQIASSCQLAGSSCEQIAGLHDCWPSQARVRKLMRVFWSARKSFPSPRSSQYMEAVGDPAVQAARVDQERYCL